jgi:DNA-binding LacI/PurR family transcriptional regulator
MGFNNGDPNAPDLPKLSTFDIPMEAAGPEAIRLLIAQVEGRETTPRQKVLYGSLVLGESVTPLAAQP